MARDDGGGGARAILEDREEVAALRVVHWGERGAEHGDEELDLRHLAGAWVDEPPVLPR